MSFRLAITGGRRPGCGAGATAAYVGAPICCQAHHAKLSAIPLLHQSLCNIIVDIGHQQPMGHVFVQGIQLLSQFATRSFIQRQAQALQEWKWLSATSPSRQSVARFGIWPCSSNRPQAPSNSIRISRWIGELTSISRAERRCLLHYKLFGSTNLSLAAERSLLPEANAAKLPESDN